MGVAIPSIRAARDRRCVVIDPRTAAPSVRTARYVGAKFDASSRPDGGDS